jgi:hypothetical protein
MPEREPNSTMAEEPAKRRKKADAFRRLATRRTNVVLEKIRILGNCANRDLYEYTEEDVRRVFAAIHKELREAKAQFSGKPKRRFQL